MKQILLGLALFTIGQSGYAEPVVKSLNCKVVKIFQSTPDFLNVDNPVHLDLKYENAGDLVNGVKTNEISTANINGEIVTGKASYSFSTGNYPYSLSFVNNNRMVLIVEASNSGQHLRLRSLQISKASGGMPIIANLECKDAK